MEHGAPKKRMRRYSNSSRGTNLYVDFFIFAQPNHAALLIFSHHGLLWASSIFRFSIALHKSASSWHVFRNRQYFLFVTPAQSLTANRLKESTGKVNKRVIKITLAATPHYLPYICRRYNFMRWSMDCGQRTPFGHAWPYILALWPCVLTKKKLRFPVFCNFCLLSESIFMS